MLQKPICARKQCVLLGPTGTKRTDPENRIGAFCEVLWLFLKWLPVFSARRLGRLSQSR
jgi:hypothetical protein